MQRKFVIILAFVFLTACGAESAKVEGYQQPTSQTSSQTDQVTRDSGGGGGNSDKKVASDVSLEEADKSKTDIIPIERKIIRNADLQLEASSPEEAQQKITAIAESKKGFVVESTQSSSSSEVKIRDVVTMTVRVPADKFNESLDEIRKTSSRVITETVKGQDVTEEFVDIEAHLKTKKALEAQFLEIMKQGKTVEDALNVQRQLANVRGEIEKIEGRKRFLESQTSLSTIKIRVQSPTALSANPSGFFYQLGESISSGFDFALNFILGLVTFVIAILPFLLFIVLPIFLLLRYFWRKLRIRKTAKEIVEEEIKTD